MLARLLIALLIATAGTASAENTAPPPVDLRGAVFCQWNMAIVMRTVAEACFRGRDEGNLAALDWAIGRMDDFILRNSTTSRADLETQKASFRDSSLKALKREVSGECTPGQEMLVFFPKPDKANNDGIRKWIDELLAVDRPPVWNPCL